MLAIWIAAILAAAGLWVVARNRSLARRQPLTVETVRTALSYPLAVTQRQESRRNDWLAIYRSLEDSAKEVAVDYQRHELPEGPREEAVLIRHLRYKGALNVTYQAGVPVSYQLNWGVAQKVEEALYGPLVGILAAITAAIDRDMERH